VGLNAEQLFLESVLPLYPEDARKDLAAARLCDTNPAKNPAIYAHLSEAAETFASMADAVLGTQLGLDFTDASIHRLSGALTKVVRNRLRDSAPIGSPESDLFNVLVHGAAYVGECIVRAHGGQWSVRRPLWESVVTLTSRAGTGDLPVFHWLLKSLADDAFDDGGVVLGDRYRAHVEMPCARPEELPIIAAPDRQLPRLGKVRYDVFYKYLKAHLPEVRDVGEHFPSPERFEELRLKWLDFTLLGGGRMLLLSGLGSAGLHLYWLTLGGFERGAFYPCETFPEPIVKLSGDTLTVLYSADGKQVRHEILYWGL
jgi:hypothetical protein